MLLDYGAKRHAGMEPPGSKASGNQAAWTINSSCWLDATLTPDSMVTFFFFFSFFFSFFFLFVVNSTDDSTHTCTARDTTTTTTKKCIVSDVCTKQKGNLGETKRLKIWCNIGLSDGKVYGCWRVGGLASRGSCSS